MSGYVLSNWVQRVEINPLLCGSFLQACLKKGMHLWKKKKEDMQRGEESLGIKGVKKCLV